MARFVVVVPLRDGAHPEASALLHQGPPVDLESAGAERYGAFITPSEAILVFEGPGLLRRDGVPWKDPSSWRDGARWQGCISSRPRVAEVIHYWERPREHAGIFFGPFPGPGDSEGGDNLPYSAQLRS